MTRVNVRDGNELKTDDTAPILQAQLVKNNGVAQDLNNFDVHFRMREAGSDTLVVDDSNSGNVTKEDNSKGEVSYEWQPGDTATAGTYECEFEIDDNSGTVKSFPNQDFFIVQIEEGLN